MATQTKSRGFTIVELLIVIVIIAILAAITIVAYNGITNRANASTAKSNAESILKVASAYQADTAAGNGDFPQLAALQAYNGISKVPSGVAVVGTTLSTTHKDGKTIQYVPLGSPATGACIGYWDASANAFGYYVVGAASTANNAATPGCS